MEVVSGLLDVEVIDSCVLRVSFEDGVVGQFDLERPSLWPLGLDRRLFGELFLSADRASVLWPNGARLSAKRLYYAVPVSERPPPAVACTQWDWLRATAGTALRLRLPWWSP